MTMQPEEAAETVRWASSLLDGNDAPLVDALRQRDEAAFVAVVRHYHGLMLRVARAHVGNGSAAEEVVQETWLAVIKGIDGFEGRSSLRTWMFRILTYQASARRERDGRQIPFAAIAAADATSAGPSVEPSRFIGPEGDPRPYYWVADPSEWPEEAVLSQEIRSVVSQAIEQLPDSQRVVISLRDLDGWSASEVCDALEISEPNQRVLLHRARSRVRCVLDEYLDGGRP